MNHKQIRLEEEIEIMEFPKNKWVRVRLFGPITSFMTLWFEIISSKQQKKVKIPKLSLDYNVKTEDFDKDVCPYRKLGVGQNTQSYLINMIVRDIQEEGPSKKAPKHTEAERKRINVLGEKWFVKENGSRSWTPARAKTWSATMAEKFASLKTLNYVKKDGKKIEYDITHPKYGCDILLKWNPDSKSPMKWEVNLSERSPLTEEELAYLIQPLENLQALKPLDLAAAKADAKQLEKVLANKDARKDVDGDDEEDEKPKKKKRPSDDEDEDDEEEEEKPKKKKKPVEDEDDEEEEESEDEESDDEDSDDEDGDEDDEDEEEEEEKPKKKSSKQRDLDDEDEEEEKPKKKKKPSNDDDDEEEEKPKKKKKKPVDDDDDEEEEKPKKKKKKPSDDDDEEEEKPKKKKKKPVDDFDDEDEF